MKTIFSNKLSNCNLRSKQSKEAREFLKTLEFKGLKLDSDKYGYTYSIQEASMNTDPFVRKALKLYDRGLYDSLRGWTKRVDFTVGLQDIRNMDVEQKDFSSIKENPKALEAWEFAMREAKRVFTPAEKLRRLKMSDVHHTLAGSTSAGFSFPGKKKSEAMADIIDIAQYMKHCLKSGKRCYVPPCKLGFRGHLSPEDNQKVRPVWIYPAEITALESCFSQPYYEFLQRDVPAIFFGEGSFKRLYERLTSKLNGKKEITTDWRHFDKLAPNFIIDEAWELIRSSFTENFAGHVTITGEVNDKDGDPGWNRIFNFMVSYFKYTRVMLPDGSVLKKLGGVPSGSMWTQVIDSIVNYIAIQFLCRLLDVDIEDLCVLGDDSHFKSVHFKAEPFVCAAEQYLGMISHPDKCKVNDEDSKERTFLGYSFDGIELKRPDREWFLRALHSERDVENLGVSASRVLGLLLVGGCNSEHYVKFFYYFMKAYPVEGREFTLSTDLTRMFKYVFHTRFNLVRIPYVKEINWIVIKTFLMNQVSVLDIRRV